MTSLNFFDLLPASLSCLLVSNWLDLASIGHLDTAYCNKSLRPSLLDILQSVECVNCDHWKCVFNNGTLVNVFEYLLLRRLKMSTLHLDVDVSLQNYLSKFCWYVDKPIKSSVVHAVITRHKRDYGPILEYMKRNKAKLSYLYKQSTAHRNQLQGPCLTYLRQFNSCVRYIALARCTKEKTIDYGAIGTRCKRLTSFACDTSGEGNSLAAVIKSNPGLEELRLRCGTPWDSIEDLRLPKLRLLHLHLRPGFGECIREPILLADNLQQLCLQANGLFMATLDLIFIAEHCRDLKSLGLVGIIIYDTEIITIVDICRKIQHLDISQNKVVTDNGILSVAQSLTDLRSINLHQCMQLTDQAMEHLAVHRAVTLEEVCLGGTGADITQQGIDTLQEACSEACEHTRTTTGRKRTFTLRWYELCRKQAEFPNGKRIVTTHLRVATDMPPHKLEIVARECPNLTALHLSPNSHALQLDAKMLLYLYIVERHCPLLKTVYLSPFMYTQQGKSALLALYPRLLFMTDDTNFYYDVLRKSVK